jgi:hypothetical protein
MGRYETLNADSQNLIDAMIPGIQQNFGIDDIIDVIPEEVRMRMWDCDRKEWVKDESEDDARHWGLQFLKDLLTISRFKKGKFDEFQAELQEKIDEHDDHPWAKLQDIKDIKEKYTPSKKLKTDTSFIRKPENSSGESSSDDSYFEELVEIEDEPGSKRRRTLKSSREKERYESRRQEKRTLFLSVRKLQLTLLQAIIATNVSVAIRKRAGRGQSSDVMGVLRQTIFLWQALRPRE